MVSKKTVGMVAGIVVIGAVVAGATMQLDPIEQRAQETSGALFPQGRSAEVHAGLARLVDVRTEAEAGYVCLMLHVRGKPVCSSSFADDQQTFTVELANTLNLLGQRRIVPENRGMVRLIRSSEVALEPGTTSRIEFELAAPCKASFRQLNGLIEVVLVREGVHPQGLVVSEDGAQESVAAEPEAMPRIEEAGTWAHFEPDPGLYVLGMDGSDIAEILAENMVESGESVQFQAVDVADIDLALGEPPILAATSDVSLSDRAKETIATTETALEKAALTTAAAEAVEEGQSTASEPKSGQPAVATTREPFSVKPTSAPERRSSARASSTDPLYQPVTIDFRNMEVSNIVSLLAQKAQVNVVAGPEVTLTAPVSVFLRNVPLLTALETVLSLSQLGIVEEEGIFRIVPYEDAVKARRMSRMIYLQNAQAREVEQTLLAIATGMPESQQISIASNPTTNVIIVSGPEKQAAELEALAYQLDVAEPALPTATQVIKLNYSEPADLLPLIKGMLTPDGVGAAEADARGRQLIVTDLPVVIEQVRALVEEVDVPVKQVAIEGMIIDAVLRDATQTGVTWLLDLVRERNRLDPRQTIDILSSRRNTRGQVTGSVQDLAMGVTPDTTIGTDLLDAGVLTFGLLTDAFDFRGAIAAEVRSGNAEILANPIVLTTENKEATITIVQDYPYQQITQTTQGPPVATTAFKEIGVEMIVKPRVTHNNDIIVDLETKQSSISGLTPDGIPIEDKREAQTTLLTNDSRTIFIGGLRNIADRTDVSKIPVLGDLPVLNFMFRSTDINKVHTELLIFLTCHVVQESPPSLTPAQQVEFDKLGNSPDVPNSQRAFFRSLVKPGEMRDPMWKWRRSP